MPKTNSTLEDLTLTVMVHFKYVLNIFVNIKRNFFILNVLSIHCHCLLFENLKNNLIMQCNDSVKYYFQESKKQTI